MGHKKGGSRGFMSGLVFGGLIGAVMALLYAPRSGDETREQLRDKSMELRERATQTAAEAQERVKTLAHDAQERADELVGQTKSKVDDLKQRGREFVTENKQRIEKSAEAAKRAAQETWTEGGNGSAQRQGAASR